jgi:hypothetical protein
MILLPNAFVMSPAAKIPGKEVEQSGWITISPRSFTSTRVGEDRLVPMCSRAQETRPLRCFRAPDADVLPGSCQSLLRPDLDRVIHRRYGDEAVPGKARRRVLKNNVCRFVRFFVGDDNLDPVVNGVGAVQPPSSPSPLTSEIVRPFSRFFQDAESRVEGWSFSQ